LAIAKEVVEAHGGEMSVESAEGKGTTIAFTLKTAADSRGA
jgi:two-component system sensor histidine kinase VicK